MRYFVAVAEEQSFGGAARRLRISQPPLSLQIKALERELGVRLFDRNTRRVTLTDSGRAFLERARVVLEEVERAKEMAKGAERGLLGKLEVGFVSSATLSLLPPAIRLFRERFGGVDLELRELTSAQQIDALYNGETRVGLVRLPLRAPGIHLEPVFEERLVVALPSGHPLEALDRVSLESIADLPLIFFTRQLIPGLHAQIIELFQRVGAFPNVAQYAVHLQTIVGLVASGVGISILPSSAMRVRREGIVYLPLDEDGATSWLGLAWVEGDNSVLVQNFVHIVREVAQSEAPRKFSQAQD
ncbi:HTH-type transcriptional regulator CatM [Rubrobacter xylanophilus DSM 9941]|nr:HTH-type transcriptional regulator CatM [Rubrobacter xylanophilus DSM 9941]